MDVSIVSVNFRSKDHLRRMVASVLRHTHGVTFELILVNNDVLESISDLAGEHMRVVENTQNLGFAVACNQGIRLAGGRYIVLLNPDIELTSDALSLLVTHLDRDQNVGIAGPRLFYPDGRPQPSVRRFPRPWDQLLILLKLPHLFPHLSALDRYLYAGFDESRSQDVDQVMGAFFVIRRELLELIGALDEQFFYWFEEVDYCKRAVEAGWKVRYYADVSAQHVGGGSFSREATLRKQAVIRRSLRLYMKKHFGWPAYLLFVAFDPLFQILALGAHIMKPR